MTTEALEALYGTPRQASLRKVVERMVPVCRLWIAASRFCVLTTVGPDGTYGWPRGDGIAEMTSGKIRGPSAAAWPKRAKETL